MRSEHCDIKEDIVPDDHRISYEFSHLISYTREIRLAIEHLWCDPCDHRDLLGQYSSWMDELTMLLAIFHDESITFFFDRKANSRYLDDGIGLGGEPCSLEIERDECV